jgi:ATP-dependent DNA ligase
VARRSNSLPPYNPQLAQLVKDPPAGDGWIHEIKLDGYRIGCALEGGQVRLLSRRNLEWTAEFPTVATAAKRLRLDSALLDGFRSPGRNPIGLALATGAGRRPNVSSVRSSSWEGGSRRSPEVWAR